jgi:hypothetical protein
MSVYYNATARYREYCPINERVREVGPFDRGPASTQPIQMSGETWFIAVAPAHQQKAAQVIPKERLSARLKLTIVQDPWSIPVNYQEPVGQI